MTGDDDGLVLAILASLAAVFILPAVVMRRAHGATDWLLGHHVLVAADHALVTIPGVAAGLDGRRLLVALLMVPAAGWLLRRGVRVAGALLRPGRASGAGGAARGAGR